jgi:hypothetical protein
LRRKLKKGGAERIAQGGHPAKDELKRLAGIFQFLGLRNVA